MHTPHRFRLAWRLLLRDWRAGELRILFAALVIAVGATSAIGFFTDRLQQAMAGQSAELLGADLILQSPRPVAAAWIAQAGSLGLRRDEVLTFPSMVMHGPGMQLAGIKAVSAHYPLRGSLRISDTPYGEERNAAGSPPPGEAWVEARLLPLLDMAVGDSLSLGDRELRVTRIIAFEPGSGGNLAALAPRVLISRADVEAAGILGPGSRVTLHYLFAGETDALARYKAWLTPQLEPSHRLIDVREGRPTVGAALERAERYLGLASLAAVLLAGVAIAMGARRYSERHFDVSAMLRCLGASQRDILALYLPQLLLLGLLGSGLGVILGAAAQGGLFLLLQELLPARLPPPGPLPALLGLLTGLVVLAGFALPPILRLRQVPALRVLRRELTPLPLRAWLVYGAALGAMTLLMGRYTGSATLTLSVLGGAAAALLLLAVLAWLLLRASRGLRHGAGVAWRYGLNNLWRRPWSGAGQILAFGLTLMAMALIALLRNDLLSTWQSQLPERAPNHFVVNVLPDEVSRFGDFLRRQNIESAQLYPLVRGRLSAVNGVPVEQVLAPGDDGGGALNRELNLTWSDTLQEDNAIVAGRWWSAQDTGQPLISLEAKLAERLGAGLGDTLLFTFGGSELEARVASLRTVKWDSFRPNFFVIFPPGVLDAQPATWMTSLYAAPSQRAAMAQMARDFPAVTVIDLERLMAQVRRIMEQVTLAVEYVLIFVLLAGFAVLYAALQASLDERLYEGALLRTLGASRYQLRAGHLAEYALLGALAGVFAAAGSELIAWQLYTRVFQLEYAFKWPLWLLLPPIGALLIGAAGYWGTRRVVRRSPLAVLRTL
jgi:putative ABC transport system permease protein